MFQINTTRPVWRSRSTHACERPRERLYTESMTNKAKPSATAAGVDASPEPHEGRTARRVTLDDIAIVAGTSIATVSRALQGSPRVAPSTRERIEMVAEQLGYRANIAASLLASSRPQILGLVCALGQDDHSARYRAEALRAAEWHGFRIIVESIDDSRDVERAWESVLQLRAQSVIAVDSSCISQRYAHVPTVLIGQQAVREDLDLITSDNERGMREAVTLLRDRGRTRRLHRGLPASARAHKSAFLRACRSVRIDHVCIPGGDNVDAGFLAVRAGLPTGVDALVCYNDQCAQGAILALLRHGLVPGRDILVVGCDNSALAATRALALTSIDRTPHASVPSPFDCAIARALGDDKAPVRERVETELVVRASTG